MEEYERLEHMELVTCPLLNDPDYYIPHHCVIIVFEASCPTSSYKLLNEILLVGPTIQPSLFLLLIKPRTHRMY